MVTTMTTANNLISAITFAVKDVHVIKLAQVHLLGGKAAAIHGRDRGHRS